MANEQQKGAGGSVLLRDRYLIYPNSPLPEFNTGSALAFLAQDRRDAKRMLFALIVRPGLPARIQTLRLLNGARCPGLMPLDDWGVIAWPPAARKVMAVVYEQPLGGRVFGGGNGNGNGNGNGKAASSRFDEGDLIRKVIAPIGAALKELRSRGLTHRAIRPDNLFWATADKDRVVLGDGVTAPPGMDQSTVMESVESAMTMPEARGNGRHADDCYAFGVTLIHLLGITPLPGADDDTVIRMKLTQGSYSALIDEPRLPLGIIELLRGLLCDDPDQRWNSDSIDLWLGGRRMIPLLAKAEKRAARAFTIGGREHFFIRDLAYGLVRNWDSVKSLATDSRIELWVRRSLDQKEKAAALAAVTADVAASGAADGKQLSPDVVLAKICMILDEQAPIRYKSLSVMPDGIGALLAVRLTQGGDIRPIAEMLLRDIPKLWIETRHAYSPDNSNLDGLFRSARTYLERGTIGNGMERVLYELNETMPCVSPFVVDDYVQDIRDLLPALNAAASKFQDKGWPVDRHVAGFISARAKFDVDRQISDLSDPKSDRSALAMLSLLAHLQWRLGQNGLYGLCGWVVGRLQPVIESYHNRNTRRRLEKDLLRLSKEGSLVEMVRLLDNPEERMRDAQGFEQARVEWTSAAVETKRTMDGEAQPDEESIRAGRQVAALISVSIALVTVSLLLLQRLL